MGELKRVVERDGEMWFVAADVCRVLELGNMRSSLALLDGDERGVHTVDTPGGPQAVSIISESGLYALLLRSRKPEAKPFKRWVTHDILPSIAKTGRYDISAPTPALPQDYPSALRALADEAEQRIQEELAHKPESGKSLRAIGRELAAEIERIFETKVNPEMLRFRARKRMAGANAPPDATAENDAQKSGCSGCSGCNLEPAQVVERVDALVAKGVSVRDAATTVAKETGRKASGVRSTYSREKERINTEPEGSIAQHYASRAIQRGDLRLEPGI